MSSFLTPAMAKRAKSVSPSLKSNGIKLESNHLPRDSVVKSIIETAQKEQFVVLGSTAATGKTSLLQLVKAELEDEHAANVVEINPYTGDPVLELFDELKNRGISKQKSDLKRLRNTWLLIDDGQNIYDEQYAGFWQFIVKTISSADVTNNLFVIIAATYDLATPKSPVTFSNLTHVESLISLDEGKSLVAMFQKEWNIQDWRAFPETLLKLSRFTGTDFYHIGVIMAGIHVLRNAKDQPANKGRFRKLEGAMLTQLRCKAFFIQLDRCYKFSENITMNKDDLLDVLISGSTENISSLTSLAPFIHVGLLNKHGHFSTIAAQWYYNLHCFPNSALKKPDSLDDLVKDCVRSMSAKRLRDTPENGFPKEATFQHLFNEALSLNLPVARVVIPELNTFATDPNDPSKIVTGELDFYIINGESPWALELVRQGSKIGEHVARFDQHKGNYRTAPTKDFLVVDCRGPLKKNGATSRGTSKCTLYFSDDFKKCVCHMRFQDPFEIELSN
ncbi:MAG: hypothetical protein SGILL_010485 [Bacillariaceae sp.]